MYSSYAGHPESIRLSVCQYEIFVSLEEFSVERTEGGIAGIDAYPHPVVAHRAFRNQIHGRGEAHIGPG